MIGKYIIRGVDKMQVFGAKMKQITNRVHYLPRGGEVRISRKYCYTLPAGSVAIPADNLIYTKTRKGCFEWRYLPSKDLWVVRHIGDSGTKLTNIDPHNPPINDSATLIVGEQEGNRVHIFLPSPDRPTKSEWRFYTYFFTDVVRKSDLTQ